MDLKRLVTLLEHMKERLDVQEPVTEIELEPITEKPTFSLVSGDVYELTF